MVRWPITDSLPFVFTIQTTGVVIGPALGFSIYKPVIGNGGKNAEQ